MKQYTKYIALGLITLFAIIATFSSLYYPPLNNKEYNFHTKNVVDDIAVIAQTPHSVEHPNERAEVRDYLVTRLKELGGTVRIYHEDSVENHVTGYTHVDNIIANFPPSDTQLYKDLYVMRIKENPKYDEWRVSLPEIYENLGLSLD